ncbi:MAG: hypothetical protein U5J82_10450 [Desulfobacterales bacterium]|nr:hypothetical protein [Desulfobacterales bacterium]
MHNLQPDSWGRLAGDHSGREIPGGDGSTDANRFFYDHNPFIARMSRNCITIKPLSFFRANHSNKRSGVGDLATGFSQRFPLLCGHDHGKDVPDSPSSVQTS